MRHWCKKFCQRQKPSLIPPIWPDLNTDCISPGPALWRAGQQRLLCVPRLCGIDPLTVSGSPQGGVLNGRLATHYPFQMKSLGKVAKSGPWIVAKQRKLVSGNKYEGQLELLPYAVRIQTSAVALTGWYKYYFMLYILKYTHTGGWKQNKISRKRN